jgi:hypothetical protein
MSDFKFPVPRIFIKEDEDMSANSKQVGGDHYKFTEGMQPWDLFGPEFLMGNAMKYIVRWRKKNGVADLEKAKHYAEKLIEVVKARKPPLILHEFRGNRTGIMVESCGKNWGLDWVERTIIHELLFFENIDNIKIAIDGIDYLIGTVKKEKQETFSEELAQLKDDPFVKALTEEDKKVKSEERRVPRYFKPEEHEMLKQLNESVKRPRDLIIDGPEGESEK